MAAPVLQFKRGLLTNLPGLRAGEPGFTTDSYDLYVGIDSTTTNNKFFGSHRYWTKGTTSTGSGVNFVEGTTNGTDFITLKAPNSLSGITTFTLPGVDGTNGQVLTTNGSGTLSFASPASSSFTITGDTGTDTFNTGETLTFAGTAKEIETTVTNNQVQIGLPNDVDIANNFKVSGISTFVGAITGTISTATRATTVDVTTAPNGVYYPALLNNYATANGYTVYSDAGIYYVAQTDTLYINGNLSVGGTSGILNVTTLTIKDKDIVVGYTTDANNNDVSTDSTASHGGIAVASTTGSPLFNMPQVGGGINSNPFTYKQFMWIAQGTSGFSGMGTDSWVSNYPVAIGTATVQNNSRFTVGAGYTFYDTYLDATANNLRVKDITAGIITATTFNGSLSGTATTTTNIPNLTGAITSNNTTTSLGSFTSSNLATALTDETGSGSAVFANTPTLVTPVLGTPTSGTLTNCTGYTAANIASAGTGVTTFLVTPSSANLATALTDETGSGSLVFANTPTLVTPVLGTPTSGTLTNCTGYTAANIASAGTGVTTFLVTPSSANLAAAVTDETGSGALVFANTPTLVTPVLGAATATSIDVSGAVNVGTALSAPTVKTATVQHSNGTQAATIDTSGNITASQNLTITGNLYVNGSTTQVNTSQITVEDRTIELGIVDGAAPSSSTTWDLGVLFNYYDSSAKKSALIWEQGDARFKLGSVVSDSGGTGTSNPQITFTTYAALELGELWINNTCTGGSSQIIACSGSNLVLQNITLDAGTF